MRQPFKDKFLSDVDGDGCPIPYTAPLALINIGRWQDDRTVQTMLADHKCLNCPPTEQCSRSGYCEQRNPEGWREVDGVKLPPINWAAPAWLDGKPSEPLDMSEFPTWVDEAREMVREADMRMDGIAKLSDSAAPEPHYGLRGHPWQNAR